MTRTTARRLRRLRVVSQAILFAAFLLVFVSAGDSLLPAWAERGGFFALDPFLFILFTISVRTLWGLGLLSLVLLVLSWILGRFFCGWMCPLGAVNDFFSRVFKPGAGPAHRPEARSLRPKYGILAAAAAAAVLGVTIGSWLDPIALLTRSAAAAVHPGLEAAVRPAGAGRPAAQAALIGGLVLLLIALNASRRRLFCRSVCPLGALYGLAARRGPLRLNAGSDCRDCGACSKSCPYGGHPGERFIRSECVLCLNCAADCRREAVSYGPGEPTPPAVDPGRRRWLGTVLFGAAGAAFIKASSGAGLGKFRRFLRPPGSLREAEFLERCVRCGQCVQACPTGFIQPALGQAGIVGLWTPVLDARSGYCDFECRRCLLVCPTGAIRALTLSEKKRFKIGTALVDRNRCYTYTDGPACTACADRCPVPEKAIRFQAAGTVDAAGRPAAARRIVVVPRLCTGCGVCEHICPRGDAPGIVITAEDEDRELPG